MHDGIGLSIVIWPIGMIIDGAGRIQFKALDTLVHEILQVVHPVFLAGSVPAFLKSDKIFLHKAQVIFLAKP